MPEHRVAAFDCCQTTNMHANLATADLLLQKHNRNCGCDVQTARPLS